MRKNSRFAIILAAMIILTLALVLTACGKKPTPETFSVSYAYDLPVGASEAEGSLPATVEVQKGAIVTVSGGDLSIAGFRIVGFSDESGEVHLLGDKLTITANVTLKAVFERGYQFQNQYLYPENGKVSFTFAGNDYTVDYDEAHGYADFGGAQNRRRLVFDKVAYTAKVYIFGTEQNQYRGYDPGSNSLNGYLLNLSDDNVAKMQLDGFEGDYEKGTYVKVDGAEDEFEVSWDSSGYFDDFRFKIGYVLREIEGEGNYIFETFVIYDEEVAGTYQQIGGEDKLTLDGYGQAKYEGETTLLGVYGVTQFEDVDDNIYATFEGKVYRLYGTSGGMRGFETVGGEIGAYQTFDVEERTTGRVKLVADGNGNFKLFYGEFSYSPLTTLGASGTYGVLSGKEIKLETIAFSNDGENALNGYGVGTQLKIAKVLFGGYLVDYALLYNAANKQDFSSGNAHLKLDGYGMAQYFEDGELVFSGFCKRENETLLYLYDNDGNERYFETTTLSEVGTEIGNYFEFDPLTGLDQKKAIHLDGKGGVTSYVVSATDTTPDETGTYTFDAQTNTYNLVFPSGEQTVGLSSMQFGDELVYVFASYHADWAGEFKYGSYTLTLDAFGMNGVYDYESDMGTFFVYEDLVTFWGAYGTYAIKLDRAKNEFREAKGNNLDLGAFYSYDPTTGVASSRDILLVLSDTTARLFANGVWTDGTVADANGDLQYEYVFTPNDGEAFRFRQRTDFSTNVYVKFNPSITGEFENSDPNELYLTEIKLDGYGRVGWFEKYLYKYDDYSEIMGAGYTIAKFTYNEGNEDVLKCVSLDWQNNTFTVLDSDVYGYYYFYDGDMLSGYTDRLFLDAGGKAEISDYDEETQSYVVKMRGSFSDATGVYVFTSEDGDTTFGFTLTKNLNDTGRDGYRKTSTEVPDYVGTYTPAPGVTPVPDTDTEYVKGVLVLYADGTATFNDDINQRSGLYTIEGNVVTFEVYIPQYSSPLYIFVITIDIESKTFSKVVRNIA